MHRTVLLALMLLLPAAAAQSVGDPVESFLDATGASATDEEGRWRIGATTVEPSVRGGLLEGLTLHATLDDAGVAEAAETLAVATGYGAGIEGPIAEFLRTRAGEIAGAGRVAVRLEGFLMHLDVRGEAPFDATIELELPRVEEAAFGPPVASLGPADADVVIREFSDFQCPYCRQYARTVLPNLKARLLEEGVRFEFHHLPLESIHANAAPAAEAAQCVADRFGHDAFWAYHDLLFERQQAWQGLGDAEPYFVRLVADLPADALDPEGGEGDGTPRERLAACLESGEASDAVDASIARARALGVSSTPSVFVGGYRLQNFGDPAAYARLVRIARAFGDEGVGD